MKHHVPKYLQIIITSLIASDVSTDNIPVVIQLIEAVLKIPLTVVEAQPAVKGAAQLPSFLPDAESLLVQRHQLKHVFASEIFNLVDEEPQLQAYPPESKYPQHNQLIGCFPELRSCQSHQRFHKMLGSSRKYRYFYQSSLSYYLLQRSTSPRHQQFQRCLSTRQSFLFL